jgi:Flp pilus assembly protein TadD
MGRIHAARGSLQEAIRLLLHAQAKAPFPEYAGLLAKLYRKAGNQELANRQIALLDVADRLDKAAGETANRNLALAFADLDHRNERALELARAEIEVRRDVYTYDLLAWALFRNGRVAEADAAIRKALSQGTPEPGFHEHAARISEALGRGEEARKHRERVNALNAAYDIR